MSAFRSQEGPRPSSSSKAIQKPSGHSSISEVFDFSGRGHKKSGSFSSRRLSEASPRRPDDVAEALAGTNRWSSSTTSSAGMAGHRKTGSFSKRFSIGAASLNSGIRSLSPSKLRRPSDARHEREAAAPLEDRSNNLPNVDRFSPLTLPSLSSDRSPPPDTTHSSPSRNGRSHATADLAQSKKSREHSHRAPSSLADIAEGEKSHSTGDASHRQRGTSRGTGESRDASPAKRTPRSESDPMSPPGKRSKKEKDKKSMLSKALKRANEAVHLDNEQDYQAAINAYEEACSLLDAVLARTSTETERKKLTSIRETYSMRIQELQQIYDAEQNSLSRESFQFDHHGSSGLPNDNRVSDTHRRKGSETRTGAQEPPVSGHRRSSSLKQPDHRSRQSNEIRHDAGSEGRLRESGVGIAEMHHAPSASDRSQAQVTRDRFRRSGPRVENNDTEAEFDAALEAAIESAYNDGYEPYSANEYDHTLAVQEIRPLQMGDSMADQARSYAIRQAKIQRLSQRSRSQIDPDFTMDFSDGGSGIDSDEEDRLLAAGRDEESTPVPEARPGSQPGIPRQSGSSANSHQTWASSIGSSVNTGATSLGTVDENNLLSIGGHDSSARTSMSPPKVPPIPRTAESSPSREIRRDVFGGHDRGESPLRDRRFSGHNKAKNLRIETQAPGKRSSENTAAAPPLPSTAPEPSKLAPAPDLSALGIKGGPRFDPASLSCPYPSPNVAAFQMGSRTPTTPALFKPASAGSNDPSPVATSTRPPSRPGTLGLRHNNSSLSLSKQAHLGVRTPDDLDPSPDTPMSFAFASALTASDRPDLRLGYPLSTPMDGTFGSLQTATSAKLKIFDHEIHSATLPGSPNPEVMNGPRALEPCPENVLLRPFWLMRCIHQTLTHPKGGYVSTRLFVPHDVWKVKSSKVKNVEDKIANCDLLTAALLKLSAVNTEDADAVLDEMQALDAVLDQAQNNLGKRLGNDVGAQTVAGLFKDAPSAASPTMNDNGLPQGGNESNTTSTGSKTGSKGYLNSWRKLRSKSSSTNLSSANNSKEPLPKDISTTMMSVPMTSNNDPVIRHRTKQGQGFPARMDPSLLEGANANYAGALARLCDAVQILDQITRQAEDPGLKFTNKTHVGLELCARHAADFFGFYVCRFILQDLSILTEKYIKRATEWVIT